MSSATRSHRKSITDDPCTVRDLEAKGFYDAPNSGNNLPRSESDLFPEPSKLLQFTLDRMAEQRQQNGSIPDAQMSDHLRVMLSILGEHELGEIVRLVDQRMVQRVVSVQFERVVFSEQSEAAMKRKKAIQVQRWLRRKKLDKARREQLPDDSRQAAQAWARRESRQWRDELDRERRGKLAGHDAHTSTAN